MSSSSGKAKGQTVDTGGLYGSSRTGSTGTKYTASDFEKNLVNQTTSAIPEYLQQLTNPTYDSEIFRAQNAQRNRLANQSFENNLINPLASRGLTRGSSVNQLSGQFANKLADLETDAMANEDNRVANVLNNLFNYYQIPYNQMSGLQSQSSSMYNSAADRAMQEKAAQQQMWGQIASGAGQAAASYAAVASDFRLKENIKPVGKLDNGLTVYVFNYKGQNIPQLGLIAQEVKEVRPEAVVEMDNGYLAVRYDLAVL